MFKSPGFHFLALCIALSTLVFRPATERVGYSLILLVLGAVGFAFIHYALYLPALRGSRVASKPLSPELAQEIASALPNRRLSVYKGSYLAAAAFANHLDSPKNYFPPWHNRLVSCALKGINELLEPHELGPITEDRHEPVLDNFRAFTNRLRITKETARLDLETYFLSTTRQSRFAVVPFGELRHLCLVSIEPDLLCNAIGIAPTAFEPSAGGLGAIAAVCNEPFHVWLGRINDGGVTLAAPTSHAPSEALLQAKVTGLLHDELLWEDEHLTNLANWLVTGSRRAVACDVGVAFVLQRLLWVSHRKACEACRVLYPAPLQIGFCYEKCLSWWRYNQMSWI